MHATILDLLTLVGSAIHRQLCRFGLSSLALAHLKRLERLLICAGEPGGLTSRAMLGVQAFSVVLLPLVFGGVMYASGWFPYCFEGPKQFLLYGFLILGAFWFPMLNLEERRGERQRKVALELPDALDLLTLSVEAGLDFLSALRSVVEKHRSGPLKQELDRFFKQIELGRPRREAMREMADRVQLSDMNAVVSALIQADRLGASIGPVLRAQSDMLRSRRSQRAEKAAQEAPVKMLAPLMVCILPSVFIMILGPVIIQMLQNWNR